jgi:tRNA modification GTPase
MAKPHVKWFWQDKLFGIRHFYDWRTQSDSIFALSTGINSDRGSPLGVIRVSGSATAHVLQRVIKRNPLRPTEPSRLAKTMKDIKPRHATLSKIVDPNNDELIDMGLVLWFPKPNSYTGEDACEFHVHGSQAIIKSLMTVLGSFNGMRPAEPGEFTRRAVANGKLDLMQAESLADLISSQTDIQRKLALQGLTGSTRMRYESWIESLIKILAHLEASIDFGEDELIGEEQVIGDCIRQIDVLAKEIADFISVSGRCRDLTESGARVVILGRPNAGKSTFMNILCRQEKSIVSSVSGTTRDIIDHSLELGGHKIRLSDTAGLKDLSFLSNNLHNLDAEQGRDHDDIEREGIRRAIDVSRRADLIIYIIDGSQISYDSSSVIVQEVFDSLKTIKTTRNQSIHVVINKIDLKQEIVDAIDAKRITSALEELLPEVADLCLTMISCKSNTNIDTLVMNISSSLERMQSENYQSNIRLVEYVNERHLSLLKSASRHLNRAKCLNIKRVDEMAQHVRESVDYLSRIVGNVKNERVIDVIFRDFCIGK